VLNEKYMSEGEVQFFDSTLVIIPARKDSQGLPGKNKRMFVGKPLYQHTLDLALSIFPPESVVVTTDDEDILSGSEGKCRVIKRPSHLATGDTPMNAVIRHVLEQTPGKFWGLLMQPTTPFRRKIDILSSEKLLHTIPAPEGVFSVLQSKQVPGYTLFQSNASGALEMQSSSVYGRQQAPTWWALNGSLYWFNIKAFLDKDALSALSPVLPYEMGLRESLDIDTEEDWKLAEWMSLKLENE
jgi:CMP-N-acetylneuraminic acid synthetase